MNHIDFNPIATGAYAYEYESTGYKRTFQLTTADGPIAGIAVEVRLDPSLPWVRLNKVRPADNTHNLAFAVAVDEGITVRLTSLTPVANAAYVE